MGEFIVQCTKSEFEFPHLAFMCVNVCLSGCGRDVSAFFLADCDMGGGGGDWLVPSSLERESVPLIIL